MEHAKKMVLVDPRMLESMQAPKDTTTYKQPESVVIDMTVRSLQEGMQKLLNNPTVSDEEKAKLYGHYLQEYLTMKNKQTQVYRSAAAPQPSPTPAPAPGASPAGPTASGAAAAPGVDDAIEREILLSVPKTMQKQASMLVERIKQDPRLDWNKRGELVVQGASVPNTNVVDLVNDVLRKRKGFDPVGWEIFARQLRRSNIPQDIVRNQARWRYMQKDPLSDFMESPPSSGSSTASASSPHEEVGPETITSAIRHIESTPFLSGQIGPGLGRAKPSIARSAPPPPFRSMWGTPTLPQVSTSTGRGRARGRTRGTPASLGSSPFLRSAGGPNWEVY